MFDTQSTDAMQACLASPTLKTEGDVHIPRRSELLPLVGNTGTVGKLNPERTLPRKWDETHGSFKTLESWVGKVITVDREAKQFTALANSDRQQTIQEQAEFSFEEISEDDASLVQPGAIFYWSVGYLVNEYGGRSTASVIRFRRLRHWTRKELVAAKARAAGYADWFVSKGATDAARNAPGSK